MMRKRYQRQSGDEPGRVMRVVIYRYLGETEASVEVWPMGETDEPVWTTGSVAEALLRGEIEAERRKLPLRVLVRPEADWEEVWGELID